MIDFLIIGGGFSGIAFSWELEKRKLPYKIADPLLNDSATLISGGLINPVTGRKYALQWNVEEILTIVKKEYALLEEKLNTKIMFEQHILKIHASEAGLEEWLKVNSDPHLKTYTSGSFDHKSLNRYLDFRFGALTIKKGLRVHPEKLSSNYFQCIGQHHIKEKIIYEKIEFTDDHFKYAENEFKNIVFCEGINALQNPWFKNIPFKPAKGECLIIDIPNFKTDLVISRGIILIPLGENKYWVGATNSWDDMETSNTESGIAELKNGLDTLLKLPYSILETKAAIRPTIRDRTPVVGRHPLNKNMFILNGMGTKGASLSIYYAQKLIGHILHDEIIPKEANVNRFYDLLRK
ncbi:MAG: NAD(P)/FAD-dependent oxidoreductase [Chitinophagales bacterium]